MAGKEEQHVWESEDEAPDITGEPAFRGQGYLMALSVAILYNIRMIG
jgi:hypothetical protein